MELQCYNKGCQKKFIADENNESACQYHPGGPVFHDALKGWSCCRKRSTDFTEMLNIPGCTRGPHSNKKPEMPKEECSSSPAQEDVIVRGPPPVDTGLTPRPPDDAPLVKLEVKASLTVKEKLEKRLKELELSQTQQSSEASNTVDVGTPCAHTGCEKTYSGEESLLQDCVFHPGAAVFHEGMKYWSCCQRKTSDFNNFLAQAGCERGRHQWQDKSKEKKAEKCRVDWHQTPSNVSISVFAKTALPDQCCVKTNGGVCSVDIMYDAGQLSYSNLFKLHAAVDPARSSVKVLPMKVEVNLKKADPIAWKCLELELEES